LKLSNFLNFIAQESITEQYILTRELKHHSEQVNLSSEKECLHCHYCYNTSVLRKPIG